MIHDLIKSILSTSKWKHLKDRSAILFILLCFIIIFSSRAYSQINFGIRTGIVMSTLNFNPDLDIPAGFEGKIDTRSNTGYNFGGMILIPINDFLESILELTLLQKGVIVENNFEQSIKNPTATLELKTDEENEITLSYLSVPFLVKLKSPDAISKKSILKPYFLAGPEIGILFRAKSNAVGQFTRREIYPGDSSATTITPIDSTSDIKNKLESTDIAVVFGAGVEYKIKDVNFLLEARFSLGVLNINSSLINQLNPPTIKTRDVRITLGIIFQ